MYNAYKDTNIGKEEKNKLFNVLETLEKDPRSYDFLVPVDYIAFGLTDYPTIVKKPMDLGTLKSNIQNEKYNSLGDALNDLQLIWTNCKTYNMEGSEIWKLANQLEKISSKLVEKNFRNITKESGNNNKKTNKKDDDSHKNKDDEKTEGVKGVLSLQEKITLTEGVRKLSNEGLSAFVKLVQNQCPSAFEDLDAEKVQVRVDLLDRNTYDSLTVLVNKFISSSD